MSNLETLKKQATELEAKLKQQVEETTAKLEEMKAEIERLENGWEMKCPYKHGDKYYYIQSSGDVFLGCYDGIEADNRFFSQGSIFPTKQAAELEVKRRNLLTRFRAFRNECNGDWKFNWDDTLDNKYFLKIRNGDFSIDYYVETNMFHTFGYFKNAQDAQRAIDLFGDEIKELFVEED